MAVSSQLKSAVLEGAPDTTPAIVDPGLRFGPFVTLMAALMGINALGIDSMLAALPAIGHALHVPDGNERQFIVSAYVVGFGVAQLVWGPAADRFGRRPVLIVGLGAFAVLSLVAGLASTFPLMLAARGLQGVAAAAPRIVVASVVRDCYVGRTMARVMSLSMMVFLAVPVIAPTLGQGILLTTGDWRDIFHFLALFGAGLGLIVWWRLRETLHPAYRRSVSPGAIGRTMARAIRQRMLLGYAIAQGLVFGGLLGFVNSVQQIFADIFLLPKLFTLVFALCAGGMIAASFTNSRIVERLGTRRVSHTALLGYVVVGAVHAGVAASGHENVVTFTLLQMAQMFCFGLCGPNFGAMAMESVGDIAGTASSVQGFVSTLIGAAAGIAISQSYDGTTVPLALGFFGLGAMALAVVLVTERGRLFNPHEPDPAAR